jgi:hypothetical protein
MSIHPNKGKRWTESEEQVLEEMLNAHNHYKNIATKLGRTPVAVSLRVLDMAVRRVIEKTLTIVQASHWSGIAQNTLETAVHQKLTAPSYSGRTVVQQYTNPSAPPPTPTCSCSSGLAAIHERLDELMLLLQKIMIEDSPAIHGSVEAHGSIGTIVPLMVDTQVLVPPPPSESGTVVSHSMSIESDWES